MTHCCYFWRFFMELRPGLTSPSSIFTYRDRIPRLIWPYCLLLYHSKNKRVSRGYPFLPSLFLVVDVPSFRIVTCRSIPTYIITSLCYTAVVVPGPPVIPPSFFVDGTLERSSNIIPGTRLIYIYISSTRLMPGSS